MLGNVTVTRYFKETIMFGADLIMCNDLFCKPYLSDMSAQGFGDPKTMPV